MQITREKCQYTACYCEENAYHFLASLPLTARRQSFVWFVSNPDKQVGAQHKRSAM